MDKTEKLRIEYIPLGRVALWDKNPKRHDVGGIIQAIQRYGFKDPPRYEPALNSGHGGLGHGNGRVRCLQMMQRDEMDRPRGIDEYDGDWAVPVVFGVDAESEAVAQAYAIDHNNLTMAGGDFDGFDMARMWDDTYVEVLLEAAEPITVDGDLMDALMPNEEQPPEDFGDEEEPRRCPQCGYEW